MTWADKFYGSRARCYEVAPGDHAGGLMRALATQPYQRILEKLRCGGRLGSHAAARWLGAPPRRYKYGCGY